jgi:uncharacterized membrane protein
MKQSIASAGTISVILLNLAFTYGITPSPARADNPLLHLNFVTYRVSGALQTWLTGVNDSGAIVGWYADQLGNTHGIALTNGKLKIIDDPSGTNTQLFGINAAGAIVGSYVTQCLEELCSEGFEYEAGTFTDLGPPLFLNEDDPDDAPDSVVYGINDRGDVVGFGGDGFGGGWGFLRIGSHYQAIFGPCLRGANVPCANGLSAAGINKDDLVTVNWATNTTFQASLYDGRVFTTINVPGAKESFAGGVSNLGDVVLYWGSVEGGFLNGALRHDGKYYRFYDPRGRSDTIPLGLNDKHVIVGAYSPGSTHDIHVNGFIATY